MPDADLGTFSVTPADLVALAADVRAIRADLDATADLVTDISEALGSDVVASALHHFVTGWRDGRKQIAAEVQALSDMLVQAASAYTETDSSLANAIPTGGS